jgi:hypothetical protein
METELPLNISKAKPVPLAGVARLAGQFYKFWLLTLNKTEVF